MSPDAEIMFRTTLPVKIFPCGAAPKANHFVARPKKSEGAYGATAMHDKYNLRCGKESALERTFSCMAVAP